MLIAVLFITVQHWKLSNCPTTGEWDKQIAVYPYNGILLSNEKE